MSCAYHRDEDFRIVKQRDDLVSAFRYAVMMRRSGKSRPDCQGAPGSRIKLPFARSDRSNPNTRFAIGSPSHPGGDIDVFTGH